MKEKELRELIEANKQEDGALNYEEIFKGVNTEINNLIAKKQPDVDKLKGEAISEFLKENGFEKADELKAFMEEAKNKDAEIENKINEVKAQYADYDTLKSQKQFLELGVKDKIKQKLLQVMFEESGEESFEDYAKKQIEENPKMYTEAKSVQTAVATSNTPPTNSKLGWETLIEEKKGVKLD